MSLKLSELIQQAETLTTDEQRQLINHLTQKMSVTAQESGQISVQEIQEVSQYELETTTGQSLLALFDSLTADMTPEEIAELPTDGAEQHDHYIYGTPKKRQ